MGNRSTLHTKFKSILGSNNVYFQPPESVKMSYPAIVYRLTEMNTVYANDKVYKKLNAYSVTVIDKNPDTVIPNSILEIPLTSFVNKFVKDNLNHYNFKIYY